MLISVIVPTFNEEDNIARFYQEVSAVLNRLQYDWEIIFINDGSSDRSAQMINDLNQQDQRIKLISLSRNFGSYSAITAGFLYAQGDAVTAISCDLQDPPDLIEKFVKAWEAGADIVWGVRETRDDPGLKSVYANIFYWLIRRVIWSDFPASGMDYGLFDRRVIHLYNHLPVRNTIPFFTIYDLGFRQVRIPYHRGARTHGVGKWTFFRRVKSAIDVILDFSYAPIRMVSLMGYSLAVLSLLYSFIIVINRVFFSIGGAGWSSTMATLTFVSGVLFIVLGVLGEYIWRVAEQVRQRPRFVIMEQVGLDSPKNMLPSEAYLPHSHVKNR